MIFITALLYLLTDAYVEHLREFKADFYHKAGVNHYWSTAFRVVYFFDLIWRFHLVNGWQILCFALGGGLIGWQILNIAINLFGGHKWYELGTTAWLDRFETKYREPVFFFRLLAGGSFIYFYYVPNPYYS